MKDTGEPSLLAQKFNVVTYSLEN